MRWQRGHLRSRPPTWAPGHLGSYHVWQWPAGPHLLPRHRPVQIIDASRLCFASCFVWPTSFQKRDSPTLIQLLSLVTKNLRPPASTTTTTANSKALDANSTLLQHDTPSSAASVSFDTTLLLNRCNQLRSSSNPRTSTPPITIITASNRALEDCNTTLLRLPHLYLSTRRSFWIASDNLSHFRYSPADLL